MKKAALLIIDMLNDGFSGWDPISRGQLTGKINELAQIFRDKKLPVIWVRQEFKPDLSDAFLEMKNKNIKMYIKGTPGAQILSELVISPDDKTVIKKRYSAFFGTDLGQILADQNPDFLVLAGINTHACIRATAVDAYQRDWNTVLATDCINSYNPDWHRESMEYLDGKVGVGKTNSEIESLLK